MVVMILESVSPGVRGELTRWMLELRAGVFVGNLSAMVRDKLWELVCARMHAKSGGMVVYACAGEQGYAVRTHGKTSKDIVDFEGLLLVRTRGKARQPQHMTADKLKQT